MESRTADEAAIRGIAEKFPSAWGNQDAKALAALYVEDGHYINAIGMDSKGRLQIEQAYAAQLTGVLKGTSLELKSVVIKFGEPGLATARTTFEISGLRPHPVTFTSECTVVKQRDAWRIKKLTAESSHPLK